MKTYGIIIIWACINVIRDTRVLGYVINSHEHWDDSRSLYSDSGLQTKEVDGLNKPVVVLVPVDRNTNRDRTNEVDSKSITHPAHKTKRCKSLTPLRKVRLSAPLKELNNDETESQSSHFMNKNEVAFPSSMLRNIAPVDDEETASMNGISIPRFSKNIDENDEEDVQPNPSPNEDDQDALLGNRFQQERKNKYLCYCINKDCAQNIRMNPSYQRNHNRLGPKLLQNTDLYSQLNALAATNSQETLGMKHKAIIAARKQGRKEPQNKKCIPIMVSTNDPMKIRLPLTMESNRRPSPAVTNPYHRSRNNYQSFQSALGIPNTFYPSPYDMEPPVGNQQSILDQPHLGSPYNINYDNSYISPRPQPLYSSVQECIPFYGREFCTSPLASLPQHRFPNNFHQYGLEDISKPNNGYSSGNCQQNIPGGQYGIITGNHAYPQFPVVGSRYTGYSDPGYDNYLEDQAKTGIVDSSTEYLMRLPDNDVQNGQPPSDDYRDDVEEESQVGSSVPQYAPSEGPTDEDSPDVSQEDSPKLGQPGYTHQHEPSSSRVDADNFDQEHPENDENVSYDEYVQESSENPISPEPGVNNGAVENPLGASHDYEDIDNFAVEGDKQSSLHPGDDEPHPGPPILGAAEGRTEMTLIAEQNQAADGTLGAPGDYTPGDEDGQSVPSTEEVSSESPIIGKAYDHVASSIHSTHPQEAKQPAESALTTLEDDETQPAIVGKPLNSQESVAACPMPETISALADKHLHDLEALTGLSIEDSKLLRGTIYEAINRLASNMKERAEARRVSSPCDIIGAPEPSAVPGLGDMPLIGNLFNTPIVRNLVVNTVKDLIPKVTGVTQGSALGQLTDNVIDRALTVVLGEEDLDNAPADPTLGVVNQNGESVPDQIMRILKSLINRPGIGLINARLPGVQNIIVRTLENILRRTKSVVNQSVIWSALNNFISQGAQRPIVAPIVAPPVQRPVIPRPVLSSDSREHDEGGTKPLPYIPVTEHYAGNGAWYEAAATVGYRGEFPEERLDAANDHDNMGESEQRSITGTDTLGIAPITYRSPPDIIQEYKKNHSVDLDNLGASTEDPSRMHNLDFYDSVSARPITQDYLGGDYGQNEGSIGIPILGQSQAACGKNQGTDNMVGSSLPSSPYLGKITGASNSGPIDNIEDLEGTDLFYIGDGVKLPLTIKRMNDGSLALMISPKICDNFMKQNCPCSVPKLGHIRQERNDEARMSRQVEKKVHSRWIRSTTVHAGESAEKSMSEDDAPEVTVMPVEKFAKKYNLTLNSGDNPNAKAVKIVFTQPNSSEFQGSMEKNQYIQDLLSIHDASDTDRTSVVINALDGLLNPSPNNVWPNGRKKSMKNAADGFEYQLENPIMERIKYIKGEQLEHGRYKYQQSSDEAASARMQVAKNILHTMKELIVEPKANEIR